MKKLLLLLIIPFLSFGQDFVLKHELEKHYNDGWVMIYGGDLFSGIAVENDFRQKMEWSFQNGVLNGLSKFFILDESSNSFELFAEIITSNGICIYKKHYGVLGENKSETHFNTTITETDPSTNQVYEDPMKHWIRYGGVLEGQLNGADKVFYPNGQIKMETYWKDGEQIGMERKWSEEGQLLLEANLKDGKLISLKCWDENSDEIDCE